jgi:hypothetical protein
MKTMTKTTLAFAFAACAVSQTFAQTALNGTAADAPVAGGTDVLALLSDPVYAPFISIVLNDAPMCLTDKAIVDGSFDIAKCSEIGVLLEAVQDAENGTPVDPDVVCSDQCVQLLNSLGESCRNALIKGVVSSDNTYISQYGEEFFNSCKGIGGAPTLAPIASVDVPAEAPVEIPVEAPVEVPVEAPVEVPEEAPEEAPVEAPVKAPVEAPVEAPVPPTPELPSTGASYVAVAAPAILGVLAMI